MPDELRSPIQHHLVLHRIGPEQVIRRFYSLMIERDLFGTVRLVRNWAGSELRGKSWSRSLPTDQGRQSSRGGRADQAAAELSGSLIRGPGFAVLWVTGLPQTGEPPRGSCTIR
jgi:predicted DNA-binding WGR domain protein